MAFGGRNGEVGAKTLAGAFQQLSRGLEVDFSAGNGAVTHIGREEWQFGREIGPLPIPRQEAMHGESVAQVMECEGLVAPWDREDQCFAAVPDRASRSPDVRAGPNDVQKDRRCGDGRKNRRYCADANTFSTAAPQKATGARIGTCGTCPLEPP